MKFQAPLISICALLPFLPSCKKEEPDAVIVTDKGNVIAVDGAKTTGENPGRVVVVKDSALIWPSAEAAIRSQTAAANNEDLETYVSYLHPESPVFLEARGKTAMVFENNDLRTTLEKLEAESVTDGEVKARFVQLTEKLSGLAFRNNRVSGVYTLRQDGGLWKIYATRIDKVDYVEATP